MTRASSGVYTAAASTWNNAASGDTISPTEWNTLLDDIETALNFGTTGATDNRLLRSDGTGGLTIQASAITVLDTGFLGINVSPSRCIDALAEDATNTAVTYVARLTHTTSGTPTAGIGAGIEFQIETAAGNSETGMALDAVTTDVTSTSEDFDFVVNLMAGGANAAERFRIDAAGGLYILDGITAPSTRSGYAIIYVDSGTGDLTVKFGDGTTKTIVVDT